MCIYVELIVRGLLASCGFRCGGRDEFVDDLAVDTDISREYPFALESAAQHVDRLLWLHFGAGGELIVIEREAAAP